MTASRINSLLILLALLILAGCAKPPKPALFYPQAPELPRYQFLTTIYGEKDLKSGVFAKQMAEGKFQFIKAFGSAAFKDKLYVTDNRIGGYAVIDFANESLRLVTNDPEKAGSRFGQPFNIAIAPDGTKYISDLKNRKIYIYDINDRYIDFIPFEEGSKPVGIAASEKFLALGDINTHTVTTYERSSRKKVNTYGGDLGISWPVALAFDKNDNLYVNDLLAFTIYKFDPAGELIRQTGSVGDQLGSFSRPKGLAIDEDSRLYVVDSAFGNIQIFNAEGQLLLNVTEGGHALHQLTLPTSITISYDLTSHFQKMAAPGFKLEYVVFVICSSGPSKIVVFGYGKQEGADYSIYSE